MQRGKNLIRNISLLALSSIISSCISYNNTKYTEYTQAACKSQAYLEKNGYLHTIQPNNYDNVDLRMSDGLQYSKNGKLDYKSLIADRQGTFLGKLRAVKFSDTRYLVYYKNDVSFSCVSLNYDLENVIFNESNCKLTSPYYRINEEKLICAD